MFQSNKCRCLNVAHWRHKQRKKNTRTHTQRYSFSTLQSKDSPCTLMNRTTTGSPSSLPVSNQSRSASRLMVTPVQLNSCSPCWKVWLSCSGAGRRSMGRDSPLSFNRHICCHGHACRSISSKRIISQIKKCVFEITITRAVGNETKQVNSPECRRPPGNQESSHSGGSALHRATLQKNNNNLIRHKKWKNHRGNCLLCFLNNKRKMFPVS